MTIKNEEGFCSLENGIKIHYKLEGEESNPLLLFSHGYGSDLTTYDLLTEDLKDDFLILRWDHRGHGQSDKPKGETYEQTRQLYTIPILASDIVLLVKALNLEGKKPFFLYGHSMGGMVAQQFAIEHEEYLKALALGSTSPNNKNPAMLKVLEQYKKNGFTFDPELYEMNVRLGYTSRYLREHPEVIEESIERKLRVGPQILLALMENFILHFNTENDLPHLTIPVLILHGKKDGTIDFRKGELLHHLIPHSNLILFPKMSHAINVEIHEHVAELLKNFFLSTLQ